MSESQMRKRLHDQYVAALADKFIALGVDKALAPVFARAERDRVGVGDDGSVYVLEEGSTEKTIDADDPLDTLAREVVGRIPATAGGSAQGDAFYDGIRAATMRENAARAGRVA